MSFVNIEIKARSNSHDQIREYLKSKNADFKGVDHQIDTYFAVPSGRLKLRRGNVENSLIFYNRDNQSGPKQSDVSFSRVDADSNIKEVLSMAFGVLVEVDKKREIYFIDNVKIHIDTVEGLGTFMEIEAIDYDGTIGTDKLQKQCDFYMKELRVQEKDLLTSSYSDMLLQGS